MTITNDDLKGKTLKQQAALVRSRAPELIAAIRKEARAKLESEGKIAEILESSLRRKIARRAGISPKK